MSDITILHLSDIHFKKKKDEKNKTFRRDVQEKLIEAVDTHVKEHGFPDFTVITGDIAFSGKKKEYDEALEFFAKLKKILPPGTPFLAVPGNHDADRGKISALLSLQGIVKEGKIGKLLESQKEINTFINVKFKAFRDFSRQLNPELYPGRDDYFWVKDFEDKNVSFLGLNSAWASEGDQDRFHIALGYPQVMAALEEAKKKEIPHRVLLLHHPLFNWLEERDKQRWCGEIFNKCSLILHGHMHVDSASSISTPSDSCISIGANATYTHDGYIGFQVIKVQFLETRVKVRVWPYKLETLERVVFLPHTSRWTGQKSKPYFDIKTQRPGGDEENVLHPLQIPAAYREWLVEFHSKMEMAQLDPNARAYPIPLPEVYIPIETVNPFYKPKDEASMKKIGKRELIPGDEEEDKSKEPQYIDIEKLLGRKTCILLQGPAGMGKTTLVKHLAHTITNGQGPVSLQDYLPVIIFLKDLWSIYKNLLPANETGAGLTFQSLLKSYLETRIPSLSPVVVEHYTARRRALFLLDGLDEVPMQYRRGIVELIASFRLQHKDNRFLLTGRPHGIDADVNRHFSEFLHVIETLDDKKVKTFVSDWFRVVSGQAKGLADVTAAGMIADIDSNPHVSFFTVNPLLLTAVCILYLDNKRLPDQRAELYHRIVDNLICRRFDYMEDPEKVSRIDDYLKLLAFQMLERNVKSIDIVEAKLLLKQIFPPSGGTPVQYNREIDVLFEEIEPSCGLLKRQDEGEVEFLHITFQEFLAARHLLYMELDYKNYLGKSWWEETILLYTGLINRDWKDKVNRMVKEILTHDHKDALILRRLWLLGAKAVRDIRPGIRDKNTLALAREKLIRLIESSPDLIGQFETTENSLKKVEELEIQARNLIKDQEYLKARSILQEVLELEPGCEIVIQNEFGFLYNFKNSLGKDKEQWIEKKDVINYWKNLWCILSEKNKFPLKIREASKKTSSKQGEKPVEKQEESKKTKEITDAIDHSTLTPLEKGEILEDAVLRLFRKFFRIAKDVEETILKKLRKQKKGPQFGHDISFECVSRDNEKVTCKIECKNVERNITEKHISHKLLAVEDSDQMIDHWILLSARSDPSGYLNELLPSWKEKGRFPFEIHLWSPESGIRELFGLEPRIYQKFYGNEKINNTHPKDWTEQKQHEVYEKWKDKLKVKPFTRMPKVWKEYIKNPGRMLLKEERERSEELDIIFNNRVDLRCKDKKSTLLNGTMEEHVRQWLADENKNVMFILGEFGDGKTAFTYFLTRNLAQDFLNDPNKGWIPVRFSLSDYQFAKDPQTFLQRRLGEFNADPGSWNDLRNEKRKILVILDGFDEMTPKLDSQKIKKNIKNLTDCCNEEFKGMKIIITSRTHFFENKQDEKLLLQRLGNPPVFYLAPIDRKDRIEYFERNIKDSQGKEIFRTLCKLHDPLDLASKPLFLQMFEATLNKLQKEKPDEGKLKEINEISIYDDYIEETLIRKIVLLDSEEIVDLEDLISNLKKILEQVAIKLQESNDPYISLEKFSNEFGKKYDEILWGISGYGNQVNETDTEKYNSTEDATTRVQVRSLLTRVIGDDLNENRPVKFCHRSIREYFVGKGICRALLEDKNRAGELLAKLPLNHEVLYFTAQLMKKDHSPNYMKNLFEITKSSLNKNNTVTPGGNAITLLYRLQGTLPADDWSELNLDGANLSGADLSGMKFKNTSMRDANLDNVIFEGADFRGSDLTGVRIEETTPVLAVATTIDHENRLFAAYKDNTIREWKNILKLGNTETRIVSEDTKGNVIGLEIINGSSLCALTNEEMIFYEIDKDKILKQKARFRMKSGYRRLVPKGNNLLLLSEIEKQTNKLHLIDLDKYEEIDSLEQERISLCEILDLQAFVVTDSKSYLRVEGTKQTHNEEILNISFQEITSLCIYTCEKDRQYLLACGQSNGYVSVCQVQRLNGKWEYKLLMKNQAHNGIVSSLSFLDETRIVSGGIDRKISILKFEHDSADQKGEQENILHMTIRCKGMKIDGLRGSKEHEMFKKLIQNG